jgi:hypothetical protein
MREGRCHRRRPSTDEDDPGARGGDRSLVGAHLRGPFAAEQSTEVPHEHHDERPTHVIGEVIGEACRPPVGVAQFDLQRFGAHGEPR